MKKLLTISLVAALAAAPFSPVQALKSDRLEGAAAAGPSLKTKVIVRTCQVLSVAAVLAMGYMTYLACTTDENAANGFNATNSTDSTVVEPTSCPLVPSFADSVVSMTGSALNGTLVNGYCKATLPASCGIQNDDGGFNPGHLVSTVIHIGDEAVRQAYYCMPVSCPTELLTSSSETLQGTLHANGTCIPEIGTPCFTGSSDYAGTVVQTNDGYACLSTATLAETMAHEAGKTLANLWNGFSKN